jgi:hypothetical protein
MKAGPRVWPFAFLGVLGGLADRGGGGPGAAERGRHSAASEGGRIQGRVEFWPVVGFGFVDDQRQEEMAGDGDFPSSSNTRGKTLLEIRSGASSDG